MTTAGNSPACGFGEADISSPQCFPVDLDVTHGHIHFLPLTQSQIEDASFLDNRLPIDFSSAMPVPVSVVSRHLQACATPAWLWHTSFCGSTLLARMLQGGAGTTVLREPLVLRRLADAHAAGRRIDDMLKPTIGLLSRPWRENGKVLIKPTHAALNIAVAAMRSVPSSVGLALTSSLEDFVISHLKKTPETLAKIPVLAERALSEGDLAGRLPREALAPPDALAAAAVQWAAQRELAARLRESVVPQRLRLVDWQVVLSAPESAAIAAAQWLSLPYEEPGLVAHVRQTIRHHSKAPIADYNPAMRKAEIADLLSRHGDMIVRTLRWAERCLLPAMRPEALRLDVLDI